MHEELIDDLRETAEYIGPNNYELPIMLYDNLLKAADAIEELTRENESLAKSVIEASDILRRRWISVEERLPEESGEYTVFIKDPFYHKSEDEDNFVFDASYVTSAVYDKDAGLWRESENNYYCANLSCVNTEKTFYITHWKKQSEPPKEE